MSQHTFHTAEEAMSQQALDALAAISKRFFDATAETISTTDLGGRDNAKAITFALVKTFRDDEAFDLARFLRKALYHQRRTHFHFITPWQEGMGDVDNGLFDTEVEAYSAVADWLDELVDAQHVAAQNFADAQDFEEAWKVKARSERNDRHLRLLKEAVETQDIGAAKSFVDLMEVGQDQPYVYSCDERPCDEDPAEVYAREKVERDLAR